MPNSSLTPTHNERYPRLDLRFSHDQIQQIEVSAKAEGISRSEWAKRRILSGGNSDTSKALADLNAALHHLSDIDGNQPHQQRLIALATTHIKKAILALTDQGTP